MKAIAYEVKVLELSEGLCRTVDLRCICRSRIYLVLNRVGEVPVRDIVVAGVYYFQ